MANPIYKHKGEEIEFYPDQEVWGWGDKRDASLAKVKAYIDRELPKQLTPVRAYDFGYTFDKDGTIDIVEVAAPTTDGKFWLTSLKRRSKQREKSYRKLYAISPHNDECIDRLRQLHAEAETLSERIATIFRDELEPLLPEHLKAASEG